MKLSSRDGLVLLTLYLLSIVPQLWKLFNSAVEGLEKIRILQFRFVSNEGNSVVFKNTTNVFQ